jgi:prepilin-type N-terminal cleavage/methylation domain-containing protein/prepilin-type processing-associated H-X9-DG protein
MDSTRKNLRGFTLVEMLVVILIIGILMGLLLPAIIAARESARAAQCINNQQELGKALIQYDLTKNRLPGVLSFVNPSDPTKSPRINWVISIFGELGRMDLWQAYSGGATATPVKVAQLICPSDSMVDPVGGLSYAVNLGVYSTDTSDYTGRLFRDRSASEPDLSVTSLKSPARTVMLSEKDSSAYWTSTAVSDLSFTWPSSGSTNTITNYNNSSTNTTPGLGRNHRGMINVTFFDGHTEKIPESTACWNDPDNPLFGTPQCN